MLLSTRGKLDYDGIHQADDASSKRNFLACIIGNTLEWYDFIIFASLSPILAKVFFPQSDRVVAVALTFTIFAISFLTRLLGGMIFGYLADKHGRKKIFVFTLLLVAIATLSIAILPTYDSIGRVAPFLLLIFRLIQGISVGGEYPILITYLAETSPMNDKGYLCSFSNVSTLLGVLLGTLVIMGLNMTLSIEQLITWGWRIPFVLSFISVILGFYLRLQLINSKIYEKSTQKKLSISSLLLSFKNNHINIIKIFLFVIFGAIAYYTQNVFITHYLTSFIGFSATQALFLSLSGSIALIIFMPIAGYLSDRMGRKNLIVFSLLLLIIFTYPLYSLFNKELVILSMMVQIILSIFFAFYLGILPVFITEQLGTTPYKCTQIALAYNSCLILFGGTAPLVNLFLIEYFNFVQAPSIYLCVAGIVSLTATLFMKESE